MSLDSRTIFMCKFLRGAGLLAFLLLLAFPTAVRAQEESDQYKIRFDAGWFYSTPSGTIRAEGDTYPIDLDKDLNFGTYSTFAGKVDWKFTHKNHFYEVIVPLWSSRTTTLRPRHRLGWQSHLCWSGHAEQSALFRGRSRLPIRHHPPPTRSSRSGRTV
jgi:hypothetical protein